MLKATAPAPSINSWSEPSAPPPEAEVISASTTGRKGERGRFCRIPSHVIESGLWARLKFSEAKLFAAFCYYANRNKGYRAWPRINTLVKMTGLNPDTVFLARKALKENGLITYRKTPTKSGGELMHYWIATEVPFTFSDDATKFKGWDA